MDDERERAEGGDKSLLTAEEQQRMRTLFPMRLVSGLTDRERLMIFGKEPDGCRHHPPEAECSCYCQFVGCSPETCPAPQGLAAIHALEAAADRFLEREKQYSAVAIVATHAEGDALSATCVGADGLGDPAATLEHLGRLRTGLWEVLCGIDGVMDKMRANEKEPA